MGTLDTILIVFLLVAAVWGYMRGAVAPFIALLGWLFGVALAFLYWKDSGGTLTALLISLLLLVMGRLLAMFVWCLLRPLVRLPVLKQLDRFLGVLFGSVRALALAAVVLFVFLHLQFGIASKMMEDSPVVRKMATMLPDRFPSPHVY
ncbi:CvpA family protein [Pasteuria penetrans]|uniref:CvpA family protein n=1 Tax=Pasteuria penetrans TaxID=86005 RepID=UPI000FA93DC1|nr:CvpA family protein [Pasteuria penetrans]